MALSKFLDPKNDFAFKRIFGTEKNQDILIDFINAVVGFTGDERIQKVSFLKTSQDPEIAYKKQSLVDVLCTAGIDSAIVRAYEELNRFSWSGIELNTYEKEEKRERDERAVLSAKFEDVRAEGKAEGIQQGMQQEQKAIAKKLLRAGVEPDVIASTTGLSPDELKQLREEQ